MSNERNNENNIILPGDENEAAILELEGERFEVIDTIEFEGKNYIAILPYKEEDGFSHTFLSKTYKIDCIITS